MLLWIDLETTGLSPQDDFIIEAAWVVTDNKLKSLTDVYTQVAELSPAGWVQLSQTPEVLEMHRNSGLLEEIDLSKRLMRIEDIEDQIMHQLVSCPMEDDDYVMVAGFSVHFDLAFIREHMPRLARMLSHRVYDVSTLKMFFGTHDIQHNVENYGKHRAYMDIVEAVQVARFYRDYMGKELAHAIS